MNSAGLITIEKSADKIVRLTISRPSALNALNTSILQELDSCLNTLAAEAEGVFDAKEIPVRVLIIQGAGEKAFVAGADVKEFAELNPDSLTTFVELGQRVAMRLSSFPSPTIANVKGYCLGGGFELALSCDFILSDQGSIFGFPEVGLGLIPGFGGTQRILKKVNPSVAKKLIFTGDQITAEEALKLGIVNQVFSSDKLITGVNDFAEKLAKKPPLSLQAAKRSIESAHLAADGYGLKVEEKEFKRLFYTKDAVEGRTAFIENRKPVFDK
ncbi:MAG TPA: enoyl-CoA hydratase-related protein [Oligoflexia bacterium]|nr:enoyl-CoA hydratase-related protein [Oligoflexia bacterium]HMP49015.1 enoyl-CoA hydratase-related protein [Oligoflexia bacterium]